MEPRIDIDDIHRQAVCESLSILLADEFILYVKTRNAHWNIIGSDFNCMHKFFENQYDKLEVIIDDVAERMRSLGHFTPATLKKFLSLTHLSEKERDNFESQDFILELLNDHETVIVKLRFLINDFASTHNDLGTSDLVTGLMKTHEKMAWMLRAHRTISG
ncbi:MAG: DNA starvation/stationary phase protection protein [Marivirga sp.]|nr:DNA starvation/stationary phase protection protein [Marivirga sp.]